MVKDSPELQLKRKTVENLQKEEKVKKVKKERNDDVSDERNADLYFNFKLILNI